MRNDRWKPWLGQVQLAPPPGRRRPYLAGRARLGVAMPITDAATAENPAAPKAIIDIWSDSCPACLKFKPVFEDVAASSSIPMFTANTNDAPGVATHYNIEALPTIIYLANGKEVHRTEGAMTKEEFLADIDTAFGSPEKAAPQPKPAETVPPPTSSAPPVTPPTIQMPQAAPAAAPASSGPSPFVTALTAGGTIAAIGLVAWAIFK